MIALLTLLALFDDSIVIEHNSTVRFKNNYNHIAIKLLSHFNNIKSKIISRDQPKVRVRFIGGQRSKIGVSANIRFRCKNLQTFLVNPQVLAYIE